MFADRESATSASIRPTVSFAAFHGLHGLGRTRYPARVSTAESLAIQQRRQQWVMGGVYVLVTGFVLLIPAVNWWYGAMNWPALLGAIACLAAVIGLLTAAYATGFGLLRRRDLYRELLVENGHFVVPATKTRGVNAVLVLTFLWGAQGISTVRLYPSLGLADISRLALIDIIPATTLAAVLLITRVRSGRRTVALSPTGIHVRTVLRRRHIRWDDVREVFVNRSILTVVTTKGREVRFFTTLVDPTFLATALTFYRNVAEARANIGTKPELAQLRAGIAAAAA